MNELPEHEESLWILTISPTIWAVHFLLSYISAAIWCAKVVDRDGGLEQIRLAIAVYTGLALVGIIMVGWRGFHRHRIGSTTGPHDFDTRESRHRFLGFATLLLSGLSAVATCYVALAAVFIGNCY
jgi:hypothetical protein